METGCCEQTVLNKTGQTVRRPTIRYRFLQLAFYHLNQAFLYKKRSKLNQSKLQKENIVIVVSGTRPANVGARRMLYQTDQTHARPDHTPKHLSGLCQTHTAGDTTRAPVISVSYNDPLCAKRRRAHYEPINYLRTQNDNYTIVYRRKRHGGK